MIEWYWLVPAYVSGVFSIPGAIVFFVLRDYLRAQRGE